MKSSLKKLSLLFISVLLFTLFIIPNISLYANEITLNSEKKTLYVGNGYTLKLVNAEGKIKWSSSAPGTVSVEEGRITAIKAGEAVITAKNNGVKYTCNVTVKSPSLNKKSIRLAVGDTFALQAKGTKIVSCTSSAPKVAEISNDGTVTALEKGKATVFVKCKNGFTYACNVSVYTHMDFIENPTFEDLAPTVNMSFEELVGNNGIYGYPEGFPVPETYRITVDLKWQVVMVYRQDENGKYTIPVRYMICSSGADKSQTPTGTFKMRDYRVRNSIFNNTDSYAQYWSLITGRIYFHSILYSSLNASDYTTASWKALGTNVSHGCIRLTVPDARWIWYNCAPGTVVEIRRGSADDKETKAIKNKLVLAKLPETRIKIKEGKIPMTDNWSIENIPHDVSFTNGHQ